MALREEVNAAIALIEPNKSKVNFPDSTLELAHWNIGERGKIGENLSSNRGFIYYYAAELLEFDILAGRRDFGRPLSIESYDADAHSTDHASAEDYIKVQKVRIIWLRGMGKRVGGTYKKNENGPNPISVEATEIN